MHLPDAAGSTSPLNVIRPKPSADSLDDVDDFIAQAVDEFTDRVNRGERPDPAEYAARFPDAASILLDILPAVLAVRGDATSPSPHAAAPPAQVGGYVLARELGRGGMGRVYLAVHIAMKRTAAVKLVTEERAAPKDLIRFLAEAEAVAAVAHPNVVQVYEYGEDAGRPFLVLELLSGGTLSDKLIAGRIAPSDAARLVGAVARGVAAAHASGIVHRDLKPGNVMFDGAGTPKVTDFGLAKRRDSDLTGTQAVMGTPAYMAPEQAGGKAKFVGPPADVWSLGVILYECVTGRRPFDGDNPWAVIAAVQTTEPPSARSLISAIPRDLDLIVRKCLEKNAADRYPTAAELADDLERFAAGKAVSVRKIRTHERLWKWTRRNQAVAGLIAAVFVSLTAGLTFSLLFAWREREANVVTNQRAAQVEAANELMTGLFADLDPDDEGFGKKPLREQFADRLIASAARLDEPKFGGPLAVAGLRSRIARSLLNLRQSKEAVVEYEKLVATLSAEHGFDDPNTLNAAGDLGLALKDADRLTEAVTLMERVRDGSVRVYGPDAADTLVAMSNLANAYADAGRPDDAIRLLEDCVARDESAGRPEAERLIALSNLGVAYKSAGRLRDSFGIAEKVYAARRASGGDHHPDTLLAQANLATTFVDVERPADAVRLLRDLVPKLAKRYEGHDHPEVIRTRLELAGALRAAGESVGAAETFAGVVADCRRNVSHEDPLLQIVLVNAGEFYLATDRFAEAEVVFRDLVKTREQLMPGTYRFANAESLLGEALFRQGKIADAGPLLERGYRGVKAAADAIPSPAVRAELLTATRERLAAFLDKSNRRAEAAKLRAEK